MGKRSKTATKENSVEEVQKDEQLPVSEESTEQQPEDTNTDGESSVGEESPASGSEDEAGVDGSGGDSVDGDTDAAAPVVDESITTLSQLAAVAPVVPTVAELRSDKAEAIIGYIREYVDHMDPSKYQDAKSGVPHQKRLYSMLVELMKLEFLDFKLGMDLLLKLIFEYRHAAFSELYSRRFFENLYPQLTQAQIREFDDILSILVTVGASANRSRAMTQVDLGAALKGVKNAKAQQNMSAYFSALC